MLLVNNQVYIVSVNADRDEFGSLSFQSQTNEYLT